MKRSKATIRYIEKDLPVTDLKSESWSRGSVTEIARSWNGAEAPNGRRTVVRMLWSKTALYLRVEANQAEPLIVSDNPQVAEKTIGLWNRDVVELFIAPDAKEPRVYFEFEVAPTGEWIDLAIDKRGAERKTDWEYVSGMESAAKIEQERVVMAMKIPWNALGKTPSAGDVWRGNLFRCVGRDPHRGYLAWSPTMTEKPNFHVPEKFGEFVFVR